MTGHTRARSSTAYTMPNYFIRITSTAGDKVLGPFEPFEVQQRAERLHDQGAEFVLTDETGSVVDERAVARGDILSPRDEELAKMLEAEFTAIWKTALEVAHGHRNVALGVIVRLVRHHIEVASSERERRLTGSGRS
jgi:hypothetical protein